MENMEDQGDCSQQCQSQPPQQPPNPSQNFLQFVNNMGPLSESTISFQECNRYIKLKQSDYIADCKVLNYYEEIFSQKTSSVVRRKWHMKDKFILFWVIYKLCEKKKIQKIKMVNKLKKYFDWDEVMSILKIPKQFLMRKWISLIRHTTCHSKWTYSQQEILKSLMSFNSTQPKWSDLAIKIYQLSGSFVLRTCKDIRQHWKNYLDPNLKKVSWTQAQDQRLVSCVNQFGKRWSRIAQIIGGRTENQVKNRYTSLKKKQTNSMGFVNNLEFLSQSSENLHCVEQQHSFFESDIRFCELNSEQGNELFQQLSQIKLQHNYLNSMLISDF